MKIIIPPIKSQGIKTKLVPWIESIIPSESKGRWVEPFMGTGVVGFNVAPSQAKLCDINPHLIKFYRSIATEKLTPAIVRSYLLREGNILSKTGEAHYYKIRKRFNEEHDPLDFLFLSRAGFNGMIRFNRKGEFNVPFCRKPQRFAQAYITKIVNQVQQVSQLIKLLDISFGCQDFLQTIAEAKPDDIVYCDPPYIGRHVEYFVGWSDHQEKALYEALSKSKCRFILSTWHHNDFRSNDYITSLWDEFNVVTREHFYHIGGKEKNRNHMVEALITNFDIPEAKHSQRKEQQLAFFEESSAYSRNYQRVAI